MGSSLLKQNTFDFKLLVSEGSGMFATVIMTMKAIVG
jgi:hypothetical protein